MSASRDIMATNTYICDNCNERFPDPAYEIVEDIYCGNWTAYRYCSEKCFSGDDENDG